MIELDLLNIYITVPFVDKGRDISGWDCWGLVVYIMRNHYNVCVPDNPDAYSSTTEREKIAKLFIESRDNAGLWTQIEPGYEREGDVILMRIMSHPCHVGMVINKGIMIHAESKINTVVESYNNPQWISRIVGFYRHAELMNVK